MESVIINFKNGDVKNFFDVSATFLSGDFLVLIIKTTDFEYGNHFVHSVNEIFKLEDIINYTSTIKTIKYDIK